MTNLSRVLYWSLFGLATIVYLFGLFVDIMDVDAAQYASISREMLETKQYLQVHHRYGDYLDKPPLLFWLSALSYSIFGVSTWAYKLPSFLFTLLGTYSTFRLGQMLYNRATGIVAALVIYTCAAFFIFNNDVRTDSLLANCVIFSIWQLYAYLERPRWLNLFLAALGLAGAMLAKGPIGLMVPVLALAPQLVLKKEWKKLFRWQWLILFGIVALLLAPMVWGLYRQYGGDGPYFFFWKQSFGRITGENEWRNDSSFFFLWHTFLWAFFPWAFFFAFYFFKDLVALWRNRFIPTHSQEIITFTGVLLPFLALCSSKYQLPHYIFVFFPLAAILTARYLLRLVESATHQTSLRNFTLLQFFFSCLLWIGIGLVLCYIFPTTNYTLMTALFALLVIVLWIFFRQKNTFYRLFLPCTISVIATILMMNTVFYPQLLRYQSGSMAARIVQQQRQPGDQLLTFKGNAHSFDFYVNGIARFVTNADSLKQITQNQHGWIYTAEEGFHILQEAGFKAEKVYPVKHFAVAWLSIPFLLPQTRESKVDSCYLMRY